MKQILSIIVLLISISIHAHLFACGCIGGRPPLEEAIKNSDVIFAGTVLSKDTFNVKDSETGQVFTYVKYSIKSTYFLKGQKQGIPQLISIITGLGNGDCGYNFAIGKKYIVYAKWQDQFFSYGKKVPKYLYTNICDRTELYSHQEEKAISHYIDSVGNTLDSSTVFSQNYNLYNNHIKYKIEEEIRGNID